MLTYGSLYAGFTWVVYNSNFMQQGINLGSIMSISIHSRSKLFAYNFILPLIVILWQFCNLTKAYIRLKHFEIYLHLSIYQHTKLAILETFNSVGFGDRYPHNKHSNVNQNLSIFTVKVGHTNPASYESNSLLVLWLQATLPCQIPLTIYPLSLL